MGKGAALRAGYLASGGDVLIVLDADGSHDPREIPRFILALLEGADFVKGSRFAPGGGTTDMPWFRKAGNGSFVSLSNILFGVRFTDLCYGYHAFWRYCLDVIDLDEFNGFEIDTALYLQAVRMKLHIVDVPSFEGYRFYGKGKLQTIPDGFRVLTTILHQWLKTLSDHKREFPACFRGNRYPHPKMIDLDREIQVHHHLPDLFQFLSTLIFSGVMQHGILEQLIKMVLNMVSVDSGSLILLDENGAVSEGCLVSKDGFQMPEMNAWTNLLQEGLAGWVVQNCATAVVYNTNNDPRWLRRSWDQAGRTAVALPLVVGGLVVGVLTLTRPAHHYFTTEELDLLNKIPMAASNVKYPGKLGYGT